MVGERSRFIANGWRQFCLIRPGDHADLDEHAHISIGPTDWLLVITQTCDLVNDVEKEPFFEVMVVRPIDSSPAPEFQHGKNSRRLEVALDIEGVVRNCGVSIHERFFVRHEILADLHPVETIRNETTKALLTKWLTSRYNRAAFPDAFDRRWKARKKQIEALMKQLYLVKDVYIRLDPFGELGDDSEYGVEICLLMDAKNYDEASVYDQYDALRKQLEDQLARCKGLDVRAVDLVSTAGFTIQELQQYVRWDYSQMSFREPASHVFPAQ